MTLRHAAGDQACLRFSRPTRQGKETFVAGASVLYFKNGKIKEQHEYWDMGAIIRQ